MYWERVLFITRSPSVPLFSFYALLIERSHQSQLTLNSALEYECLNVWWVLRLADAILVFLWLTMNSFSSVTDRNLRNY